LKRQISRPLGVDRHHVLAAVRAYITPFTMIGLHSILLFPSPE
jgi:hypothetical protein